MKLVIASNNAHKLREIKQILEGRFDAVLSLAEAGITHETVEDGATFEENALKKARETAALAGCAAIADDSGLCVDALNGAPGVFSARFAGVHGDDAANNKLLLEKVKNSKNRSARYVCAIALVCGENEIVVRGCVEGEIIDTPMGHNGFGYDPIFFLPELGRTMAQISAEEKNKISHRAIALEKLLEKL